MRTPTRRRIGALATIAGLSLTLLGFMASPAAAAFEGECTPTDANSGTCVIDEPEGSDSDTHGTATYVRSGDTLTFTFTGTGTIGEIQACVTVNDGQANPYIPTDANTCAGNTSDRIYAANPGANPLVLDLTDVPGYTSGDAVYFAIHINQTDEGQRTTYIVGGAGGGGGQQPGDVSLAKVTTGPGDPADGTSFLFDIDCSVDAFDGNDVAVPSNGAAVTVVNDAPSGTTCRIREDGLQGAVDVSFSGGTPGSDATGDYTDVTVGTGTTVAVTATNTYRSEEVTGSVTLDKVTTGNAPAATTDFTFTIDCQSGDEDDDDAQTPGNQVVISPEDGVREIADDIELDDTCTITETGKAGASSTTFTVNGSSVTDTNDSITVTITEETPDVAVVATNNYPTTTVVVIETTTTTSTTVAPTTTTTQPAQVLPQEVTTTTTAPVEVAGVQQQRPAALARTGLTSGTTNALALAGVLLMLGGLSLAGSSYAADRKRIG